MRELEVRERGQHVEADADDRIVVRIPENATTGYRWVVDELPDSVELLEDEFMPPGSVHPGAEGERRVVLRAKAPGSGTVALRLERPWEHEAVDRFEALVTVR